MRAKMQKFLEILLPSLLWVTTKEMDGTPKDSFLGTV